MYTIKHVAEMTGLNAATLRAWERRYGVVTPHRTEAGYRLYDDEAVRTLTLMAALVLQGWSPRQAAQETQNRAAQVDDTSALRSTGGPALASGQATDALIEAAAELDSVRLSEILDERFSTASFESVVDGWLMPSLVSLGKAWAEGRVSVAGEHLASYTVMRRLAAAYEAASSGATGPRIVVGMPPGSRHELGVLAFAVAARRAGLRAAYVGADLPAPDWRTAVVAQPTRAVVLAAVQESDLVPLGAVVEELQGVQPGLLIAVGGSLQARAPAHCLRLGDEIGAGAAMLAATLGVGGAAE